MRYKRVSFANYRISGIYPPMLISTLENFEVENCKFFGFSTKWICVYSSLNGYLSLFKHTVIFKPIKWPSCVGPGAKLQSWAPLIRDTRKVLY